MSLVKKVSMRARALYQGAMAATLLGYTDLVMAQSTGDLSASAGKLNGGLTAVKNLMPIVAQILGLGLMIGGGMMAYKHFKSQGRDGNLAAGLAGAVIGAVLFFLGGFLKWTASSVGLDSNSSPF